MRSRARAALTRSTKEPAGSEPSAFPRIVYLDQCALSRIVKGKDAFWDAIERQLKSLIAAGRVACPASVLHEEESRQTADASLRDALGTACRQLSAGFAFRPPEEIETLQLQEALRNYVRDAKPPGEPEPTAESLRRFAREAAAELRRWLAELVGVCHSESGPEPTVRLVRALADTVREVRPDEPAPDAVVEAFFRSTWAQRVPFLALSSRLRVLLREQAEAPKARRVPKPSDRFDAILLSHFAPYCDAVFLDNEFRKLALQRNLDLPGRYGVQLFSESNREGFRAYLQGVVTEDG